MNEILKHLAAGSRVLDLGCRTGSFSQNQTPATVIRLDRDLPGLPSTPRFVQADAAQLPFPDRSFAAVIANHSLEHFDQLDQVLGEIGRVLGPGGALFVSVPDASTFTDKAYRWLARGGGHVNPFTSAPELATRIEQRTGLPHAGTRLLYSSLSFMNARNAPRPRPRRLLPFGGGAEWTLFLYSWISRRIDRYLKTRTSVYGWALYFGNVEAIETEPWINVCIRCGSGAPISVLATQPAASSVIPMFRVYKCPCCGATNPLAMS